MSSRAEALVARAVAGPSERLDATTRAHFEARVAHEFGRMAVAPRGVAAEDQAHALARRLASPAVVPGDSPRRRLDFAKVRIHTDSRAAASARALGALAYTLGEHVVFGARQYEPSTSTGRALLAHELTHVVQQRAGDSHTIQRANAPAAVPARAPEGAAPESAPATPAPTPTTSPAMDVATTAEQLNVAGQALALAGQYDALFRGVRGDLLQRQLLQSDSQLPAGVLLANRQVAEVAQEQRATTPKASRVKVLVEGVVTGLRRLVALIAAIRTAPPDNDSVAEFWESERQKHLATGNAILGTPWLRQAAAVAAAHDEQSRIDEALTNVKRSVDDLWRGQTNVPESVQRRHGRNIAGYLVGPLGRSGDLVRAALDKLRVEDPEHFARALCAGGTIVVLLEEMKIGGLQAYRAIGEGFVAGLRRGEMEARLAGGPEQRHFGIAEKWIAFGGVVAGVLQGIGDDILSNVKGTLEMVLPSFWRDLKKFLTEVVPKAIESDEYRFEIGQMMGQGIVAEERRLATADPFEYGRTIGHLFGQALVEVVLAVVGLGWALKAARAAPRLARILRPMEQLAQRLGKTAAVARVLSAAQALGLAIDHFKARAHALWLRLPAVTRQGKLQHALQVAEDAARQSSKRVDELEDAARKALAAGDHELAQEHVRKMEAALADLERDVAAYEKQAGGEQTRRVLAAARKPLIEPVPTLDGKHHLHFEADGLLTRCSTECEILAWKYKDVLDQDPALKAWLEKIQEHARSAEKAGDGADMNKAAQRAREFETVLRQKEANKLALAKDPAKAAEEASWQSHFQQQPAGASASGSPPAQHLARGNLGERLAADWLAADGHQIVYFKPDIRGTSVPGIDIVSIKNGVVHLVDNKALTRSGNVSSVTALTANFNKNVTSVVADLVTMIADPKRSPAERALLQQTLDAIKSGNYVRVVTNANLTREIKVLSGVTQALATQGIQFLNVFK